MSLEEDARSIGSSKKIDYRVRASKQIERRMIAVALNQLVLMTGGADAYRYIGMGSIAFMDFQLFHRAVGLRDMVSIERAEHYDRAVFNQPLGCIKVVPGDVNKVLPDLELGKKSILWLDYDGKVQENMLEDAGYCARKVAKGSVLMITVNCNSGKNLEGEVKAIQRGVKKNRLSTDFGASNLVGWKYAEFIRLLFRAELQSQISLRNKGKPAGQRLQFRQFLYFCYKDNAKMCTIGWIFDSVEGTKVLETAKLERLDMYRPSDEYYLIDPPVITPAEARHVGKQLPSGELKCPGLTDDELQAFGKLYNYFPMFYEVTEA